MDFHLLGVFLGGVWLTINSIILPNEPEVRNVKVQ